MEGTLGETRMFAGNFAPRNWALCEGQLLSISQFQALFSVLGTQFGGDGQRTFGLPDLRGRVPVGVGVGPGLTPVSQGQRAGVETVQLSADQMPTHTHAAVSEAHASDVPGTQVKPANQTWAGSSTGDANFGESTSTRPLAAQAVTTTVAAAGGGQAHENRQPQLGINFIICLEGLYPSRS